MKYSTKTLPIAATALAAALLSFSQANAMPFSFDDVTGGTAHNQSNTLMPSALPDTTNQNVASVLCNINMYQNSVRVRGFLNYLPQYVYDIQIDDQGYGLDKAIELARIECRAKTIELCDRVNGFPHNMNVSTSTLTGNLFDEPFVWNCK